MKQEIEEESTCERGSYIIAEPFMMVSAKIFIHNGITDYEDKYGSALRLRAKERMQYSRQFQLKEQTRNLTRVCGETQDRLDDHAEILKIETR